MASAKKCDRCGRFYECYEGAPIIPRGNKYNGIALTSDTTHARCYDLCFSCMSSLIEWLAYDGEPDNEQDYENIKEG